MCLIGLLTVLELYCLGQTIRLFKVLFLKRSIKNREAEGTKEENDAEVQLQSCYFLGTNC